MNADASRRINVDAKAGVKFDGAIRASLWLSVIGLLACADAMVVILLIGRRVDRDSASA